VNPRSVSWGAQPYQLTHAIVQYVSSILGRLAVGAGEKRGVCGHEASYHCQRCMFAIGTAAPAIAADLRMPVKALPPPVVVSWTAGYVGVNAGGGYTEKEFRDSTTPFDDFGGHHGSGAVGGGQVGCDYQAGMFVFGVQGMFDGTSIKGNHFDANFSGDDFTTQIKWFGTATARLGITFLSNGLFYVKGGGAWVRDNFSIFDSQGGGGPHRGRESHAQRLGRRLRRRGPDQGRLVDVHGIQLHGIRHETDDLHGSDQAGKFRPGRPPKRATVTLGINYRFGWAGPVVAKY